MDKVNVSTGLADPDHSPSGDRSMDGSSLDRQKWLARCSDRYVERAGLSRVDAEMAALTAWGIRSSMSPEAAADLDVEQDDD